MRGREESKGQNFHPAQKPVHGSPPHPKIHSQRITPITKSVPSCRGKHHVTRVIPWMQAPHSRQRFNCFISMAHRPSLDRSRESVSCIANPIAT